MLEASWLGEVNNSPLSISSNASLRDFIGIMLGKNTIVTADLAASSMLSVGSNHDFKFSFWRFESAVESSGSAICLKIFLKKFI